MSQEQAHHHRNPYSNKDKARRLKRKANYYAILNGELFKKGLTTPILKCLISQQVNYIMREAVSIHGDDPLQQRWCILATIAQHSGPMPLTSSRDADDAKSL